MPRIARHAPGGYIYHVLNRANGRLRLFKNDKDFLAFGNQRGEHQRGRESLTRLARAAMLALMPRRPRIATGGVVYHVLNRAAGRGRIFDDEADYLAMERVIERTHQLIPVRILSYCLMPNHWHLVLWPRLDGQLSEFMRLLDRHAHAALARASSLRRHADRCTRGGSRVFRSRRTSIF